MAITDLDPAAILKSVTASPDHAARIFDRGELMKAQRAHARTIQTAGESLAKANARAWATPEGKALRAAFDKAECPPGFYAAIAKTKPKPRGRRPRSRPRPKPPWPSARLSSGRSTRLVHGSAATRRTWLRRSAKKLWRPDRLRRQDRQGSRPLSFRRPIRLGRRGCAAAVQSAAAFLPPERTGPPQMERPLLMTKSRMKRAHPG